VCALGLAADVHFQLASGHAKRIASDDIDSGLRVRSLGLLLVVQLRVLSVPLRLGGRYAD